jgi:hypothetical protein
MKTGLWLTMNSINQKKDMNTEHHTVEGTIRLKHKNTRQAETYEKHITLGRTDQDLHTRQDMHLNRYRSEDMPSSGLVCMYNLPLVFRKNNAIQNIRGKQNTRQNAYDKEKEDTTLKRMCVLYYKPDLVCLYRGVRANKNTYQCSSKVMYMEQDRVWIQA